MPVATTDWIRLGYDAPIVLALVEAVSDDNLFANPWVLIDGDATIAADTLVIGVSRNTASTRLRIRGGSGAGLFSTYFSGTGLYPDAKIFIVVEDSVGNPVNVPFTYFSSGGSTSRWDIDDADQASLIAAILDGDQFVIAIAEPTTDIQIDPTPIDGELSGDITAILSLGEAPPVVEPPVIPTGATLFDSTIAVSDANRLYWRYTDVPFTGNPTSTGFFISEDVVNPISPTILEGGVESGIGFLAVLDDGQFFLQIEQTIDFTPAFETTLRIGCRFNNVIYRFLLANDADNPYQWFAGAEAIALFDAIKANPTLEMTAVLYDTEVGSLVNPETLELASILEFQGQPLSLGLALSQATFSPLDPTAIGFQGQPLSLGLAVSQASLFTQDAYTNFNGQPLSLGLSLSQPLLFTQDAYANFNGQPLSLGLSISRSSLFIQDAYASFNGQSLSLGLSISRATLNIEDITRVDFRGRPLSLGLSISQATLAVQRAVNLLGRASPIRNSNGVLTRPEELFAPIPALKLTGTFPAFCPSKRVLLGSKVYPFAGLDYIGNFVLSAASWRRKRDNNPFNAMQDIPLGNFTDILAAIRFTPQTLSRYGTYLYEITLISEFSGSTIISINIPCNVIAGLDKSVQRDITFKPFADFMIAKNSQALQNIQYEISGDTTLARRDIGRTAIFSGQHEAIRNADYVFDGKRDFNRVDINLGSDILYSVGDQCSGVIMSIGDGGNSLIPDVLTGGTLNQFNPGDSYLVQDGDDVDKRARKLELSIDELSTSLVQLIATDLGGNDSIGNVLIRCD